MIRNLPPTPSRDRPNEFSGEMDAFLAALPGFVDDANALEQSLQLVATTGTSATSLTVGVGSKSLTTAPGKAWATGAWVYIFAAASVSNYMVGRVTSYNTTTGALVVNVSAIDGGGTHSSWIIGLATPAADGHLVARDGSRSMTAELPLAGDAVNALGAVPKQQAENIATAAATSAVANRMQYSLTASQATTSGSAVDFTGIPSWARRVTLIFRGVSTSGTSEVIVQMGTSAGMQASGYTGGYVAPLPASSNAGGTHSIGFALTANTGAVDSRSGALVLVSPDGLVWVASGLGSAQVSGGANASFSSGLIQLTGSLDRLRLRAVNGTDVFDAGSVSLLIEG